VFNIREGELRIALLMQFYIFIIIAVLLLVKPTITALFLSNLGADNLPYAYLLVAIVAVIYSIFNNWLILKFSIRSIAVVTIVLFSICFFALYYIIEQNILSEWSLYFYYLAFSLFGVMAASQFWIIANIVFDLREAKRLFGFIGAGAIAGGVVGGYITTLITAYFGNGMVIMVAAFLLLICLPLIFIIWKIRVKKLNRFIKENRSEKKKTKYSSALKLVINSKHLTNLALIVGISVVVAKLIDFQFNDYAHRVYTNPDELASFFGFWFSSFNIVALLIQLFLTNRLLAGFGVNFNMLLLPLGLIMGSLLFIFFPELWVVILLKGTDISFKQSVNKAAYELSILPVPYETKQLTKPFIDVVVDSLATGMAGFLLLFIIKRFNIDLSYFTIIILFFLFIWLYLLHRLKASYFDAFRKNIKSLIKGEPQEGKTGYKSNASVMAVFKSGNEAAVLKLLQHPSYQFKDVYMPYLLDLLNHPSDRVKVQALREIHSVKSKAALEKVRNLIATNKDDAVIYEAMEYFLLHFSEKDKSAYYKYLDHEKDYISNAALLCLANASRYNKVLGDKYDLDRRIESKMKVVEDDKSKMGIIRIAGLLLAIGYSGNRAFDFFIEKYLKSDDELLKTNAIRAVGLSKHEIFIVQIGPLVREEKYRNEVIKAVHAFGEPIVKLLFKKDEEEDLADDIRAHIPSVIESFKTRKSVVVLKHLLSSKDVVVRLNASRVLDKIVAENHQNTIPEKKLIILFNKECDYFRNTLISINSIYSPEKESSSDFTVDGNGGLTEQAARVQLIKHLSIQSDYSLETIFNYLSLRYKDSDMKVVLQGIKNDTKESKINAIEFLENLLTINLRNKLMPLLEYSFLGNSEDGFIINTIPEGTCLLNLLDERGAKTKINVLNLMLFVPNKDFIKPLNKLLKHKNEKVRKLAKKNLKLYKS